MRYILTVIFCLWAICAGAYTNGFIGAVASGGGASLGGIPCEGVFSAGAVESFENTDSATCTTTWIETDTGGVINLKDTAWTHCGTTSMSIMGDTDTVGLSNLVYTLPAEVASFTLRVYFKAVDVSNFANFNFMRVLSANMSTRSTLSILKNTTLRLKLLESTEYFILTPGAEYYTTIEWDSSAVSKLRLYATNGTPVLTNLSNEFISVTIPYGIKVFHFQDTYDSSAPVTLYVDDVVYSSASADFSGGQVCN